MERIEEAARELREADVAVALTGAGVSAPSGVPPFRGEGGIWSKYDPEAFHLRRFRREPGQFWEDWLALRAEVADEEIRPNPAHEALAALEDAGHLDAVITQNVDGLHQAAAEVAGTTDNRSTDPSQQVVELHGNASRAVCQGCGRSLPADEVRDRARGGELPPRCEACDGVLKPDAVLFGEQLPARALDRAEQYAKDADAFLVAGSSLTVEPAASLPERAVRGGATLVLVDLEETPVDSRADFVFREDVTDALPALRDAVIG